MEKLQSLSNITRLSKRVCRILGQNPGKFTLQGTNTYLIGERAPFILLDTGEGRQSYLPLLEEALKSTDVNADFRAKARVPSFSDVILTHHHRDHFGGLREVLELSRRLWEGDSSSSSPEMNEFYGAPRIHKFNASDYESETTGPSKKDTNESAISAILASLPTGLYSVPQKHPQLIHDLVPLQTLKTVDGGSTLTIIHTPGHTPDSICLYLHEDRVLFTADSVLGQGTAVFEDLAAYIRSLEKLLEQDKWTYQNIYPGHGPVVDDGPALIKKYISHRMEREEQIVGLLEKTSEGSNIWSIEQLVSVIYKDYPKDLWIPAAHSIELHLRKLQFEGQVRLVDGEGMRSTWQAVSKL